MAGEYVTLAEMCESLGGVHPATIRRMINIGDLPPFDVGSNASKTKAWHRSTLEDHARRNQQKYESADAVGRAQ